MARNFADLYENGNYSSSLEQAIYVKEEPTVGTLTAPAGTDFFTALAGSQVAFTQPKESSDERSGRQHTSVIEGKVSANFQLDTYFHIDTTLGTPSASEILVSKQLMLKSLLGNVVASGAGVLGDVTAVPSVTFSIFECVDHYSSQSFGCYVEGATWDFPGDGRARASYTGLCTNSLQVGIAKTIVDNNGGNIVTGQLGDEDEIPVGAFVMIIKDDGITRSTDTPSGSPRKVTAVNGLNFTLDGAALTDADGSTDPVYLAYYEPATITTINDPQTGLKGSMIIDSLGLGECVKSASITFANNHEPQDDCYGEEGLNPMRPFAPGGRLDINVEMTLNLNKKLVGLYNRIRNTESQQVDLVLGDDTTRHLAVTMPKVIFELPEVSIPETGSVPVTFSGLAYQTANSANDTITVSFI